MTRIKLEITKAERVGITIDTITDGTSMMAGRMEIDMSDSKSIAVDLDLGMDRKMQAAKVSGGEETNKITIDPPRDAEEGMGVGLLLREYAQDCSTQFC